jgi:hypothetical protein
MTTAKPKPEEMAVTAWKGGIDAWWRALEAMTEGARKMHEIQLKAAAEAHASTEASRKQLAEAADAQAAWRIQAEWLSRSATDSLAYWRRLAEIAGETQAAVATCMAAQAPLGMPLGIPGQSGKDAMMQMMDKAYRQWLETTQQFYAAPVVAQPQVRQKG